jgi:hypothetical protein
MSSIILIMLRPMSRSQVPLREVPPHTGFGSDADSLQSIYHLIPKVSRGQCRVVQGGRQYQF